MQVLIVIDESGNVEEEQYKDTESISLYETMRQTLIMLTILNSKDMTNIMLELLYNNVIKPPKTQPLQTLLFQKSKKKLNFS
jgi:hypothetical protein